MLRVAIVAGETSGDTLGAALIEALRTRVPQLQVRGVAGPAMRAAGCEALADAHELAVMGLIDPLKQLPRLLRLRARLLSELTAWRPQVFIGIDAPGFNLTLAGRFKARGVKTVQYVSPQIWAWRPGRVRKIARRCDLVLCLLPFEPAFYADHAVRAEFVGHPLADQIPLQPDRQAARAALGVPQTELLIALLPGSRLGEVTRLAPDFIAAVQRLTQRLPAVRCVAPMASPAVRREFERALAAAAGSGAPPAISVLDGHARNALTAADVALVASGTATLEALLCRCPMVAAYRFGSFTAALMRLFKLVRLPYFSLPNLLAREPLVGEFLQEAVTPERLAAALEHALQDSTRREYLQRRFEAIHESLRAGGAARAAQAVLELLAIEAEGSAQ